MKRKSTVSLLWEICIFMHFICKKYITENNTPVILYLLIIKNQRRIYTSWIYLASPLDKPCKKSHYIDIWGASPALCCPAFHNIFKRAKSTFLLIFTQFTPKECLWSAVFGFFHKAYSPLLQRHKKAPLFLFPSFFLSKDQRKTEF